MTLFTHFCGLEITFQYDYNRMNAGRHLNRYLCVDPLLDVHGSRSHVVHLILDVDRGFISASDNTNNSYLESVRQNIHQNILMDE